MPKINVYLPSDLAAAVRTASIPVSPICQKALAEAVRSANRVRLVIDSLRDPGLDESRLADVARDAEARMTRRLQQVIQGVMDLRGPGDRAGTGHLLLGLLDDAETMAVTLLQALDVDIDDLRATAERISAGQPEAAGSAGTGGSQGTADGASMPWALTMPARNGLAAAIEAAVGLGHNYVGSEHLLLGLLAEPGTAAATALGEHQVQLPEVRRALKAAVAGYAAGRESSAIPAPDSHEELRRRLEIVESRLAALMA